MSFGYSVGDFVILGQLAWTVFKSCKDAPESFTNISQEVLSLHAVIKEFGDNMAKSSTQSPQLASLASVAGGCEKVLRDLQNLTARYYSLGSMKKRKRDRLTWGKEDIAELRSRLISNTALMTAFISTSQITVHNQLQQFLKGYQQGCRGSSPVSNESISSEDKKVWREIRKELEGVGVTVASFNANRSFIVEWFRNTVRSGKFEECHNLDEEPFGSYEESQLGDAITEHEDSFHKDYTPDNDPHLAKSSSRDLYLNKWLLYQLQTCVTFQRFYISSFNVPNLTDELWMTSVYSWLDDGTGQPSRFYSGGGYVSKQLPRFGDVLNADPGTVHDSIDSILEACGDCA